MGHLLGGEKIIFLIRDIDGLAMTAALVETCRFLVLRSPWGCLGSLLDMGSRLRRIRRRSEHSQPNSLSTPRDLAPYR